MRRLLVVLLLLPAAALASDPASKTGIAAVAPSADREGIWRLTSMETGGQEIPLPPGGLTYHFRNGHVEIKLPKEVLRMPCVVDATRRPHWISMGKDMDGIYGISGNRLEICGSTTGKRPQYCTTQNGQPATLVTLTRIGW
jgi:uncharacterized protein (TIGR03067 family)